MQNSKNGVVYIVTAKNTNIYLKAAMESAKSVKRFSPSLGTHVFTDSEGLEQIRKLDNSPFDSTGLIENPHYRSKVDYIAKTPFHRTLYLDSDTRVVDDITELFSVLDRFDIALAHAHRRNLRLSSMMWQTNLPPSYPHFNGGVILYKNTKPVIDLLSAWGRSFHEAGFKKDQVTLRELLWKSDLRLATLPPEYNVRYSKYLKVWRDWEAKAKILHMAKYHNKYDVFRRIKNGVKELMGL